MLTELVNRNPDLQRLIDRGFALAVEEGFLIVRDIPYLDTNLTLQVGAIVTKLEYIDQYRVKQDDHQVYFAGGVPYGLDGGPIPNLGGGACSLPVGREGVTVQRSFSNKPASGAFPDFFEKITHYVNLISGPAMERDGANPLTFRCDEKFSVPSVFKFADTLTSRAEIGDLVQTLRTDIVAVIGLGGTGSYVLDFLAKTPVAEIRAFDGDRYHVHNAFRSPGQLITSELGKFKAEVYQNRYETFRYGVHCKSILIDESSAEELRGVTFAFVCVDKGSARSEIITLLSELGIPFIDVGLGIKRLTPALGGMIRTTFFKPGSTVALRSKQIVEEADAPDDEYRTNIQIAELNALNACYAVLQYKKLRGFYADARPSYHAIFQTDDLRTYVEEGYEPDQP